MLNRNNAIINRRIRVFVSSTFRDMVEDRNALMTHTWPQLRQFCSERNVELTEVDLRWGILEEQSTRHETLKLILDEIHVCRPFFVGLLGERYGWIPEIEAFTADLKEEQGWITALYGKSVTELEILHGVLNKPELAGNAFFYFRDPAYAKKRGFDYLPENITAGVKQERLKNIIRRTCAEKTIPLCENYPDPEFLAALVLKQLQNAIDELFPVEDISDLLDLEAREHETFAEKRRITYIGRQGYYDIIDENCNNNALPLLVTGDSGIGKSALFSNWIPYRRRSHPDDYIFQHYIGSTYDSANHLKLIRRLIGEIKRWTDDDSEIPETTDTMLREFPIWLAKARIKAEHDEIKFIVILDGLNQLEENDRGQLLGWLPTRSFTGSLRLFVSTVPGEIQMDLQNRGWQTTTVNPLTPAARHRMISCYLLRFGKKLDRTWLKRLAIAPITANPLYLKILLDELRVTGTYDHLDYRLTDYLSAKDIPALYQKVLVRYQHDYEHYRKGMVSEVMSLIWAARRGLSETELLVILRPANLPQLPHRIWAPLRAALEEVLIDRGGILDFAHNVLRSAVEAEFLSDQGKINGVRKRLADYFEPLLPSFRSCHELPWLLKQIHAREPLLRCLLNIEYFLRVCVNNEEEIRSYWVFLAEVKSMGSLYLNAFNTWANPSNISETRIAVAANSLGHFLKRSGASTEAEYLYRKALNVFDHKPGNTDSDKTICLHNLSLLLVETNHLVEAESLMRKAIELEEAGPGRNHPNLATKLSSLGHLLKITNKFNEAEAFMRRALDLDEKHFGKYHSRVAIRLDNLASLLQTTGHLKNAEELILRALLIHEQQLGKDHPNVGTCLNNLAFLLANTNRLSEAEAHYRRSLQILEQQFGPDHPAVANTLCNLGQLLQVTNRLAVAEQMMKRAINIYELNYGKNHPKVAVALNALAVLLYSCRCFDEAEPLMRRALQIAEYGERMDGVSVGTYFNNLSQLLKNTNRLEKAEPLMKRAVDYLEHTLGRNHPDVATALGNLAELYQAQVQYALAEPLMRRSLEILLFFYKTNGYHHQSFKLAIKCYSHLLKTIGWSKVQIDHHLRGMGVEV